MERCRKYTRSPPPDCSCVACRVCHVAGLGPQNRAVRFSGKFWRYSKDNEQFMQSYLENHPPTIPKIIKMQDPNRKKYIIEIYSVFRKTLFAKKAAQTTSTGNFWSPTTRPKKCHSTWKRRRSGLPVPQDEVYTIEATLPNVPHAYQWPQQTHLNGHCIKDKICDCVSQTSVLCEHKADRLGVTKAAVRAWSENLTHAWHTLLVNHRFPQEAGPFTTSLA